MEERNYTVYMHVNKINGKKYIGITSQKPEKRWRYGYGYTNNEHFTRSIKKYGWSNFNHEILFTNLTQKEAEIKEIELIAKYKTTQFKYGYNKTNGGECKGKFTEETKRIISEKNKGKPSYWKGKHLTKEMIDKLKMANKDKSISIFKIDLSGTVIKEYSSICEAAMENNISKTTISRCCKGKQLTCKKYIYLKKDKYMEEIDKRLNDIKVKNEKTTQFKKGQKPWNAGKKNVYTKEQIEAMSKERRERFKNPEYIKKYAKSVYQIDLKTGEKINKFISISEAERTIGKTGIKKVCKGLMKSVGGYGWEYCEKEVS